MGCFLFLILLSNKMLPPLLSVLWAVCISVPASVTENNIVRGNQPSVSVLVWGGLNIVVFVYFCCFFFFYLAICHIDFGVKDDIRRKPGV